MAVRAEWPADKPLSVRISAADWAEGGLSEGDLLAIARAFQAAGVDLIDVSSGQTVPWQKPVYGRMYQAPFSDNIRNDIGIATMAVGNIYEPDHVNSIIASGRADLCAIARPHLTNPAWTLEAAARQGYHAQWWPTQYLSGKSQIERNLQRAAQTSGGAVHDREHESTDCSMAGTRSSLAPAVASVPPSPLRWPRKARTSRCWRGTKRSSPSSPSSSAARGTPSRVTVDVTDTQSVSTAFAARRAIDSGRRTSSSTMPGRQPARSSRIRTTRCGIASWP